MRDDFLRPSHFPLLETLLFHKNLPMKGIFTVADAAELFDVCVRTIQLRVRRGQLNARALPGRARFLAADLEQFLRESSTGGQFDAEAKAPLPFPSQPPPTLTAPVLVEEIRTGGNVVYRKGS